MSRDSFLKRDSKKGHPSYRRAKKQEKELACLVGGRRTSGSGNKDEKGDIRIKSIARIECKTTCKKSFSVTTEMISKIEQAALGAGELPIIVIEFNDGMGNKINEVAVMPMWAVDSLIK